MRKDNSTFSQKIALRQSLLDAMTEPPIVLETHGGLGKIWQACYSDVAQGCVFEKDQQKAEVLALQRPGWAVYEDDAKTCLQAGAASHLAINFVDFDPYGEGWPFVEAFLLSERPKPDNLYFAVNDGLRQKLKLGGAWSTATLRLVVQKFGNNLYPHYLGVCEYLLATKAADAGYDLLNFRGYYCGHARDMTHFAAVLKRA